LKSRDIARRYADALYEIARDSNAVVVVEDNLRQIVSRVEETPEFGRYLEHPLVTKKQKAELIDRAFSGFDERLRSLLHVLVHNGREAYLALILDEFIAARADDEQLARVTVVSAHALEEEERARLTEQLESALGQGVQLDERVDETLLAGVRVEIEGRILDGTLRAKLDQLRSTLGQ